MNNLKLAFSRNARKFQIALAAFVAVVIAAFRDGNLSTGDKWEIFGAAITALGVFTVENKPVPPELRD